MTDNIQNAQNRGDDMADFLQMFLDETEEQLDGLVETLLALERDPTKQDELNEAFRLVHSIKGSAGMMGFDSIALLTHHLENRFERFRSGTERLDELTMNVVLRCIDFLRQCNNRLRDGERLGSPTELFDELKQLEERAATLETNPPQHVDEVPPDSNAAAAVEPSPPLPDQQDTSRAPLRIVVRFRAGMPLADLKAQLIVARLSKFGDVRSTEPDLQQLSDLEHLEEFAISIETEETHDTLRAAADVDGVDSIDFAGTSAEPITQSPVEKAAKSVSLDSYSEPRSSTPPNKSTVSEAQPQHASVEAPRVNTRCEPPVVAVMPQAEPPEPATGLHRHAETSESPAVEKATTKVAETMRVDIDRLDTLMNLAGELVVNRARFVQISRQISPALRRASLLNRMRDFRDSLRRTIENLVHGNEVPGDRSALIQQLRSGMEWMDEQAEIWENGRYCLGQITEAVDQLSRVSHSLQRGVLDTRMVPVGPLFNRFQRVVRDLSKERGKKVNLLIRGEKTELDKRMIDELGDPLVHLVRNSIDHGLEPPDVRIGRGKPEAGTILLEASHRGNNVYIHVQDDGGGIDIERIRTRLIDRQILSASAVAELSDAQALDYIWHPGFSTAKEVTDISGRGVGMDVVKTRISVLNGTIEVDSTPQRGTAFMLRLPLTLAIINSLLVRLRHTIFSIPIDDVREIVSVKASDVVTLHGKQTFDVRGKFVPLVSIDDVFHWHGIDYGYRRAGDANPSESGGKTIEVVILHVGGKTMGLRVEELLGCQDVVIKSLADNFIHIRGLSGASILGDGSVCLMLDIGTLIDMASRPSRMAETEDVPT